MVEIDWLNLDGVYADRESSITVGVFDGLHLGHRALIDRVVHSGRMPVVVTFQRHPTELLLHDDIPGFIMSLRQKRTMLTELGIDVVVQIDFTESFRSMPGSVFLSRLDASFLIRRMVVGHDFRCGFDLDTDIDAIEAYFSGRDLEVIPVDPVTVGGSPVSSTRIRMLICEGKLDAAAGLLGRPYALDVMDEEIERDDQRLYIVKDRRGLLPESRQLVPPSGVYAAEFVGSRGSYRAALEIGENSLSWPLAVDGSIRYIVPHQAGIESKELSACP